MFTGVEGAQGSPEPPRPSKPRFPFLHSGTEVCQHLNNPPSPVALTVITTLLCYSLPSCCVDLPPGDYFLTTTQLFLLSLIASCHHSLEVRFKSVTFSMHRQRQVASPLTWLGFEVQTLWDVKGWSHFCLLAEAGPGETSGWSPVHFRYFVA